MEDLTQFLKATGPAFDFDITKTKMFVITITIRITM